MIHDVVEGALILWYYILCTMVLGLENVEWIAESYTTSLREFQNVCILPNEELWNGLFPSEGQRSLICRFFLK